MAYDPQERVGLGFQGYLVVEPTHLKNMIVKLDHFPKEGWKSKIFELPPPSNQNEDIRIFSQRLIVGLGPGGLGF